MLNGDTIRLDAGTRFAPEVISFVSGFGWGGPPETRHKREKATGSVLELLGE
jgi:hypothetical protein